MRFLEQKRCAESNGHAARFCLCTAKDEEVEKMFHEQKDAIDYENQVGHAGWLDCFRRPNKTLYRTILGMTLQAGQQLTGANYFFYVSTHLNICVKRHLLTTFWFDSVRTFDYHTIAQHV